jgi:hypothetical protein
MPRRKRTEPVVLCGARRRQGEGTCRKQAGWGTRHQGIGPCRLHGGLLPNHIKHAERVRVELGVRTTLARERLVPLDDPLQQLQLVAAEVLRLKDILAGMVDDLPSWIYYEGMAGREDVRAVLSAYERAQNRALRVLTEMVKLDLDERLAKVSAAQAAILIQLIEAVILAKEMGLTREQVHTAKAIIARELPRLSALPAAELRVG